MEDMITLASTNACKELNLKRLSTSQSSMEVNALSVIPSISMARNPIINVIRGVIIGFKDPEA